MSEMDEMRKRLSDLDEEELCFQCGLRYGVGWHEVDDNGRFPAGGHYFVEEDEEE